MLKIRNFSLPVSVVTVFMGAVLAVSSAHSQDIPVLEEVTYADLIDLSDRSNIVLRAEIRKQAELEPERSPGLQPGYVRLYIEAQTSALLAGRAAIGESLRYLVDVPRQPNGKAPKLKKKTVLLFAQPASGRAGDIQLITPTSQLMWTTERESRLRGVLSELYDRDAPAAITGIRDVLSIRGNLAGESETQLFLSTANDGPVSVSVVRRPGQAPVWGVSRSAIVDQAARPPATHTLAWYRLACFLPARLPDSAYLSTDRESRSLADRDYQYVLEQLGPCPRTLDL